MSRKEDPVNIPSGNALFNAIIDGDVEKIDRLLVEIGVESVRVSDGDNRRAIHHAAMVGNAGVIQSLVKAGSPVNLFDVHGLTPLHLACLNDNAEAADMLISKGAHMNTCSTQKDGELAMHIAARHGHVNTLKVLIQRGGNVNVLTKVSRKSETPLHKAVACSKSKAVQLLCEAGADLSIRAAVHKKQPLHIAAEMGDLESVNTLLKFGAPCNDCDGYSRTPLMHAVREKHIDVVRLLLRYGVDMRSFSANNLNVVHSAVISRNMECLECLLAAGADVNVQSQDTQETPIMMSLGLGLAEMVKMLLKHGADVNLPDHKLYTCLHRCPIIPFSECVRSQLLQMLLDAGADLEARDHQGYTPLQRCLITDVIRREGGIQCIQLLVEAGSILGPDEYTLYRNSPLLWLCFSGRLQKAVYLVNAGWNLTKETWIDLPGKTPLQTAVHQAFRLALTDPQSLRSMCRLEIRRLLFTCSHHREIISLIQQLPVPQMLKHFLMFRDRDYTESAPDLIAADLPIRPDLVQEPSLALTPGL